MLSRRHEMPFGAAVLPEGGVRFRLWAPAARTVGLRFERDAAQLTLRPAGDGWFELITDAAAAGDLYRYVIDGDGVDLFAPEARHGRPEALKSLVAAAHRRGLMVLLDVVYNHFGPEGNYLHRYAPPFFAPQRTPWGEAIDFSCAAVRAFFTHNAL